MANKFALLTGIILLTSFKTGIGDDGDEGSSDVDYSQVTGLDVDKIALNDDLSGYMECKNVFLSESEIMGICKNDSICRLLPGPEGYLQVFCDCSNTVTEAYYYMGPQCETKMVISYSQIVSGFSNTSWLEDLFAMNSWKNDFSRVGLLF